MVINNIQSNVHDIYFNLGYYDFVIHHDFIPYELTFVNPTTEISLLLFPSMEIVSNYI